MEGKVIYTLGTTGSTVIEGGETGALGFPGETSEDAFATRNYLNLPRDFSAVNRKGMHMTSAKGVPLLYHCRLTFLRPVIDDSDVVTYFQALGAQNNWVTRNASVKLHHAREQMFKNAGIRKSERGRYDKTLRLNFDAASQTWTLPYLNDGTSTFTDIGEWDVSKIAIDDDTDLIPTLFGAVANEEASINAATFNIQNAYLNSRRAVVEDAGEDESSAPHSIIRSMFNVEDATDDELQAIADANQDATPYDHDGIAGSFTSQSLLGLGAVGAVGGAVMAVMDVDVPFGIMGINVIKATIDGSTSAMDGVPILHVELLGISEMQG
jgi:hypothetical protein